MALSATINTNSVGDLEDCYIVVTVEKSKIKYNGIKIEIVPYRSQEKRIQNIPIQGTLYTFIIREQIENPEQPEPEPQEEGEPEVTPVIEMMDNPEFAPFIEATLKENSRTDLEQAYLYIKEEQPVCLIDYDTLIDC